MASFTSGPTSSSLERLRIVIQSAFATFDRQQNGTIQVEEVGTIMRWLGQFPAEQTLTDVITKQLIEECHGKEIAYEAFERVMLKCLIDHAYDPDDQATLLTAFRTMDTEGRGYVEVETLRDWLSAGHQGLREKELNEFVNFAKDLDEPEKVYYEDYVWKLHRSIQSHVDRVYAHVRASAGHGRKH